MKQRAMNHRPCTQRRLMREIYWHRMLGNLLLQLPWVKRTSPVLMHLVRKMNACCVELHRMEVELCPSQIIEKTAA